MPTRAPLTRTHPHLAADWHPDNELTADQVHAGSSRRARWRCATCTWEWSTLVFQRGRQGSSCPACAGRVATPWHNLARTHPDLAAQWHPANELAPEKVLPGSHLEVTWRCDNGHTWGTRVAHRTRGARTGCPHCAGRSHLTTRRPRVPTLAATHPRLVPQWHPDNDKTPDDVTAGSSYRARWRCAAAHTWVTRVSARAGDGSRCPGCTGRAATADTNLTVTHPQLAAQWHPDNDRTPDQVVAGSYYRARWQCPTCGWHWQAMVYTRAKQGAGCPACAGRVATGWNNLTVTHPQLAAQWHPDNDRVPEQVVAGSSYRARWRCPSCGHSWQRRVNGRTGGRGPGRCPGCRLPPPGPGSVPAPATGRGPQPAPPSVRGRGQRRWVRRPDARGGTSGPSRRGRTRCRRS